MKKEDISKTDFSKFEKYVMFLERIVSEFLNISFLLVINIPLSLIIKFENSENYCF